MTIERAPLIGQVTNWEVIRSLVKWLELWSLQNKHKLKVKQIPWRMPIMSWSQLWSVMIYDSAKSCTVLSDGLPVTYKIGPWRDSRNIAFRSKWNMETLTKCRWKHQNATPAPSTEAIKSPHLLVRIGLVEHLCMGVELSQEFSAIG